jgi:polyisoprenoid-binding protein YceI
LKPGRWLADPAHSGISFSIRHLGLSKVKGNFGTFDAWLDVGTSLDDTRVEATIDMASVDTNQDDRDQHLRAGDFFDVENHPQMRFTSTEITGADDTWRMEGELTILGQTHAFGCDVEFNGTRDFEPTNDHRAGFEVSGELKRSDLGLDFGIPASAGILLGDTVKFELDLQFVEPTD